MKLFKVHLLNSFLFGLCLLSGFISYGQGYFNKDPRFLKANSIWAFGDSTGLDFNTGKAVAFKTSMQSMEGNVAVADPNTGKLLFYSNGGYIMDASHQKMPNGSGLTGNPVDAFLRTDLSNFSTTQGVCAVPMIDSPGKYFLFSMRGSTSGFPLPTGSLFYSVVDMSLNNGLGDIVPGRKNISLDSDTLSESMIAIPGENCDVWLLIHNLRKAQFKAYRITSAGVNTVPVISNTGQSLSGTGAYGTGYLAVSPDRKRIAITSLSFNPDKDVKGALIAKFDPATGQVTDGIKIVNSDFAEYGVTGICFSPDNSRLYLVANELSKVTYNFTAKICQFDVDVYDSATIVNSAFVLSDDYFPMGGLRLYNDTIYAGGLEAAKLGQINRPNLKGAACEFQKASVNLAGKPFYFDLGNDVVYTLTGNTSTGKALDTAVCPGLNVELKSRTAPGHLWDDGSVAATRTVNQAGTYWVSSIDGCDVFIDTFVVRGADQLSESIQLDTTLCPGFDLTLESINTTAGNYLWNDGSTSSARQTDTAGTYWVRSLDGCHTFVDTFIIAEFDFTTPKIWVDRDTLGTTLPYHTYQWLLNDTIIHNATNSTYTVPKNGKYRVIVTNEHGCTDTSEVYEVTNVKIEDIHSLAAQVRVYPNPASDVVYVIAPVEVSLSLHSIEGKVINHPGNSKQVSLQGLAEGMYFLQIYDRSGRLIRIEKVTKVQ